MSFRTIDNKKEADEILATIKIFQHNRSDCSTISDFSGCFSKGFFSKLVKLCKSSGDDLLYVSVLSPDPISYFFYNFKEYPIIEFSTSIAEDEYFHRLSRGFPGSPADAITYNSETLFIFPNSHKWYICADRSSDIVQHCIIRR